MEIIEIRGWIADPQFPVNIKAIRRILDFKPLGKNNLENITVHNVFLCLPNDVHIGILARVGMYDGSSCFQGWLWCWVISANLLCQFFRSPESCCILGIQVAICVQILNYNPVVFQVVIGNQFFIQKQIAVWHVNVIFRNIHQCFFQIPHGIISEIANQSACEIRCIRQNRSGILCHSFFQVVFGKVVVAQQLDDFHADVGNFLYDFQIVAGIVMRAFGIICHVKFLAQVAVVGIRHERAVTWGMQGEYPTFHTFFLRCLCGGINGAFRQTGQL